MLVRLLYASRSTSPMGPEMLAAIVRKSTHNNAATGITGLLCHTESTFLQVLEGGREAVSTLYQRIANDPLHDAVTLLAYDEIEERDFAGWSMGRVDVGRLNPSLILKYSKTASLDPYAMPGRAAHALLKELVETASVACVS